MASKAKAQKLPTGERLAKDAIRELYRSMPLPPRVSELLARALELHLIPDEVVSVCQREGLMRLVREALKEPESENGLSMARPMGRGPDARWHRITVMTCHEATEYLIQEAEAIGADIKEFRKYEDYFRDKYGDAIPQRTF